MDFIARLPADLDQAMTLFTLRRFNAKGEFITASGASDVELRGEVPDDKFTGMTEALAVNNGAMHAGGKHWKLEGGKVTEAPDINSAESHLGGPFTMDGATRATWSYGGDTLDHIVQALYLLDEHVGVKAIQEATGRPIEHVMKAVKALMENGTVRKYRAPGDVSAAGEMYDIAGTVRHKIDALIQAAARDTDTASE